MRLEWRLCVCRAFGAYINFARFACDRRVIVCTVYTRPTPASNPVIPRPRRLRQDRAESSYGPVALSVGRNFLYVVVIGGAGTRELPLCQVYAKIVDALDTQVAIDNRVPHVPRYLDESKF